MNAREEFPTPERRWSRAGSESAYQKNLSQWAAQREQMCDEIDRLRADLDAKSLALIECRNPGIDMDDVRRIRQGL